MNKVASLLVLALAAVALVACGGSSNNEEGGGETAGAEGGAATKEAGGGAAGGSGGTLKLETDANGTLAYTTPKASTKAGEVTVDFTNPQPLEHDVAFEDASGETVGKTELVAEGSTSASVELKPGTYNFFCTVPGHREAGMEGTLVVK